MNVVKAPGMMEGPRPWAFLSGSIEMGAAEPWQARVEEALADLKGTILNPRRDDWDSSWVQSIEHPQFREQVEWELRGLASADIVAIYFQPGTKSPITLLEFGMMVGASGVVVCCPPGFWRRGNVQVVCATYAIPLEETLEGLIERVRQWCRGAEEEVYCPQCLARIRAAGSRSRR